MDDLEDLLKSTDKSKRQECNPLSVKPSVSEMFLEATSQLKGTELKPEDIRNYTLNRYNVDVIECMNDINLLTRFSEIKVPKLTAAYRKNRKVTKCAKYNLKSPKSGKRFEYSDKLMGRLNLPKKRRSKPTKKVPTKNETQRRIGCQTKSKKASLQRKSTAQDKRWRSRIPLIRLTRNRSPFREDLSPKTGILDHNTSVNERTVPARPQIPLRDSPTRQIFTKAKSEILLQNQSNASTGAATYVEGNTEINNYIHSELSKDNVERRGSNEIHDYRCEKSPMETLTVKEVSKIVSSKQNKRKDLHGSFNSESKIMKAGYAVKHYLEDLSNKYASSLMFCNQRKTDRAETNRDDLREEKMSSEFKHNNLQKEKINADVKDGLHWEKIRADLVADDLQRNKMSVNLVHNDFRADEINPSSGDKVLTENKICNDLVDKGAQTDKVSPDSINKVSVESVPAIFLEMPKVKKLKKPRNSRGSGNKVDNKFKVNKRRNNSRGVKEIETGRKKALSEMKNGNTRAVKTLAKTSETSRLKNQYKIEPKTRLCTFENERKSVKEISKHNKRTFSCTPVSLNTSNNAKKSKTGTKRNNVKVTFEEDWGEECNRGKIGNTDSCNPKNSDTGNRIERLRKLVEKRRLKTQAK